MTLRRGEIRLTPLMEADPEIVFAAMRDERITRLMPVPGGESRETFAEWWRIAQGNVGAAFAVWRGDRCVGSTRLTALDRDNAKCELGHTWYVPDEWGTDLNPTCKRRLLTLAFEDWTLNRVEFRIDARNARSRAAVAKLGAVEEGVIRADRVLRDGYVRDTVLFSILRAEWPSVKERLLVRIAL